MKNLIFKELKLAVHPTCYLFLPLAAMLLIPSYPYYVAFFYQTLGIFFIFLNGNATNDIFFTVLLPIRKRDAVKARFYTVILFELLQVIMSIPFAILRYRILPVENPAGMEANIAFFGLVLMMFGIFNATFLPMFYRTAFKPGAPYLVSCVAMMFFVGLAEALINIIPTWKVVLDTTKAAYFPQQSLVFVAGVILLALLTTVAYRRSIQYFEKLDL
jgi:hypothetical protein